LLSILNQYNISSPLIASVASINHTVPSLCMFIIPTYHTFPGGGEQTSTGAQHCFHTHHLPIDCMLLSLSHCSSIYGGGSHMSYCFLDSSKNHQRHNYQLGGEIDHGRGIGWLNIWMNGEVHYLREIDS